MGSNFYSPEQGRTTERKASECMRTKAIELLTVPRRTT